MLRITYGNLPNMAQERRWATPYEISKNSVGMYPTLDEPEDLPGEVWNLREKGRKLKH
jgi:hypothetical protein